MNGYRNNRTTTFPGLWPDKPDPNDANHHHNALAQNDPNLFLEHYQQPPDLTNAGTVKNLISCHQASIDRHLNYALGSSARRVSRRCCSDDSGNANRIKVAKETLKNKIQSRPNKRVLIDQHILEDTNAAPSLQIRQQNLKRAKLVDDLKLKLCNRPGPLELVEHNILETPSVVKKALEDGLIMFDRVMPDQSIKRRTKTRSKIRFSCSDGAMIFHQYKGPNVKDELSRLETSPDTSEMNHTQKDYFNVLLEQQKLFLELVQRESTEFAAAADEADDKDLMNVKLSHLQRECRARNLSEKGNKQQLLSRIVNHDHPVHTNNGFHQQPNHLINTNGWHHQNQHHHHHQLSYDSNLQQPALMNVKTMAAAWMEHPPSMQHYPSNNGFRYEHANGGDPANNYPNQYHDQYCFNQDNHHHHQQQQIEPSNNQGDFDSLLFGTDQYFHNDHPNGIVNHQNHPQSSIINSDNNHSTINELYNHIDNDNPTNYRIVKRLWRY